MGLPICFQHAAIAWEHCQGLIVQEHNGHVAERAAERDQQAAELQAHDHDGLAAAMREADDPTSVVYYLRFADRIKIGYSRNLGQRLVSIPHDELLTVEPGAAAVERYRHRQFADYRITGEWFQVAKPLLDHIELVKKREPGTYWGRRLLEAACEEAADQPTALAEAAARLGLTAAG